MSEATLIFPHMRGGCATVGNKVHALFRVNGRRPGRQATQAEAPAAPMTPEQPAAPASPQDA